MSRTKIESLTQEQIARFPEYVRNWTDIGLCTAPASREAAEEAIYEIYRAAGKERPRKIVWCGSPLSQGLTRAIILDKKMVSEIGASVWASVRDSVGASVGDSVGASVRDSVRASVWASVWASVGDSLRASVGASVGDSVGASVRDSVGDSVGASVRDSVGASVGDSVGASVRDSVRASVWASVWASVGDSLRASVGASVGDSVGASVRDSVRASVRASVGASVGASVWASVRASVGDSVGASVWDSVRASVRDSVGASVRASVGDSVRASVGDSVWASVGDSVWASVRASVRASVWASVWASVRDSVWASVWDSVGDSVWASVRDSVGASVRASVGASVWASVGASAYGQHDASWLAFYKFFHDECKLVEQTEKLEGLWLLAKSAGWMLPHENICWVSERHNILERDERGLLHNLTGPACAYPDGWAIYAVHGVRVPSDIIEDRSTITVARIEAETNAEVRRVMIDLYGSKRYLVDSGATVIQELAPDHYIVGLRTARLLRKEVPNDETIIMVDVLNSTPEPDGSVKRYQLRIDPSAYEGLASRDCLAAVASTWRRPDGSLAFKRPQDYQPVFES